MNEILVFFGSFFLLLICYIQLRLNLSKKDWMIFFWGGLIYFIGIPFFVDSSLLMFGGFESFNQQYLNENPTYWSGVNLEILTTAVFYTFFFVMIYRYSDLIFYNFFNIYKVENKIIYNFSSISIFILFLISLVPCLLLMIGGADFIENQNNNSHGSALSTYTSVFLPLSAVMIYYCILKKKYTWVILFTLPLLMLSIFSQSRTLFFYIPAAYLMAYFKISSRKINLAKLSIILVVLLSLSQIVKIFINENYGFNDAENKIAFIFGKTFRDVSIGDFYYSIDVRNTFPNLTTEGKSTLALVSTGVIPPMLGNNLFDPQNTATYRIYQLRFGNVDFGSMHPTLLGYSFFDLGWLGIILAIWLPFILRFYQKITYAFTYTCFISPVMISAFMFVALRGSLNVAYFKLIYGGISIFIILVTIYMLDSYFLKKNRR